MYVMKKIKNVELLVPAGGEKQFIAAVENGADAVYLGGRAFNARINAGNFDDEMMKKAIDYAHRRGVKVFVTMNTLIKDEELAEAVEYAGFLYKAGADALIIQDLGFGDLIGQKYPGFERHLSTQASSYDVKAIEAAAMLGYKRVVPARELTLEEIKAVCDTKLCDIEVFVHGALCICYSGQCQLSRYYGGRSGNRGQCAQPCRLPYTCDGKKSYPLSPRDNCLIDCLGELIEAGVYSFKIEGRMKSPEYVAVVTSIYRKYIDMYLAEGKYTVSDEDRLALSQIFNRGDFTKGYLYGESGEELMSDFIPKNQGVKIGEVSRVVKGSSLIDIRLDESAELSMGDGVELHRRGSVEIPSGNIISYLKPLGGLDYRIGDLRGEVKVGDLLYRTSSKNQIENARRSFNKLSLDDNKDERQPIRKLPIEIELMCYGGTITLTAKATVQGTGRFDKPEMVEAIVYEGPFDYDYENPTPVERYESAFKKTGNTPFVVESINAMGDFDISIKMSELNALRRKVISELEAKLTEDKPCEIKAYELSEASEAPDRVEAFFYNVESYEKYVSRNELGNFKAIVPLADMIIKGLEPSDEIIPYISNITKGIEDEILSSNLDEVVRLCKDSGVYVGNLGWLLRMNELGVKVYGDFGLNAYNEHAKAVIERLGAEYVLQSLEAETPDAMAYPLMTSEHEFLGKRYEGLHGRSNLVTINRDYSSQSLLVPSIKAEDTRGQARFLANGIANSVTRVYNLK